MLRKGWIAPQTCYRLDDVTVSNNESLSRMILECKVACFPFSCTFWNVVKNMMQCPAIMVGETKLFLYLYQS